MSNQGYEEELRSERSYLAGLYARLDAERARVKGEYNAALRGNGGTPMERDVEVRALAKEVKRLDVADNGLCFGRLDTPFGRPFVHRPDRLFRRGERVRTGVARLAGAGVARVLRRHRRVPGEHASAPPVPHARASWCRSYRATNRASQRLLRSGLAGSLVSVVVPRRCAHETPGQTWRPRPDSNLRSGLRRPAKHGPSLSLASSRSVHPAQVS